MAKIIILCRRPKVQSTKKLAAMSRNKMCRLISARKGVVKMEMGEIKRGWSFYGLGLECCVDCVATSDTQCVSCRAQTRYEHARRPQETGSVELGEAPGWQLNG